MAASVLNVGDIFGTYRGYYSTFGGSLTPSTLDAGGTSIITTAVFTGAQEPAIGTRSTDITVFVSGGQTAADIIGDRPLLVNGVAYPQIVKTVSEDNVTITFRYGLQFVLGANLNVEFGALGERPGALRKINQTSDDGTFSGADSFNSGLMALIDTDMSVMRFANLPIPAGANILTAELRVYTKAFYNNGAGTVKGVIGNVLAWNGFTNRDAIPLTTTSVPIYYGTEEGLPVDTDVQAVVQAVVNGTWAADNSMGIVVYVPSGSLLEWDLNDFQDSTLLTAELYVTWESGSPVPVITSASNISLYEGQILYHQVTCSKPIVELYVVGGADQALFMSGGGAVLRWFDDDPKSYSSPEDAGANNVYNVTIRVEDFDGLTVDQNMTITVLEAPFMVNLVNPGGGFNVILSAGDPPEPPTVEVSFHFWL